MSALPHNLERSAFHRGEHVAYGAGFVWRVTKRRSGGYCAAATIGGRDAGRGFLYGRTLAEIAARVAAAPAPRHRADAA